MTESFEAQIEFLRSRGATMQPHSLSNLIHHLIGTREILLSWQASPVLCTAGLFHSVYGTESFDVAIVDLAERDAVRRLIGGESEEIVYFFSVATRVSFEANFERQSDYRIQERSSKDWTPISLHLLEQLCTLSAANWLEQRRRLPSSAGEFGRERYRKMLEFVLPAAAEALREAYSFPADGGP